MSAAAYTAKDITVLEGLEPVRKRPSMYIGGVDGKGLHHLVWEIVDNAVDEYLNAFADAITVTLHKGGDAVSVIKSRGCRNGTSMICLMRPGCAVITTVRSPSRSASSMEWVM